MAKKLVLNVILVNVRAASTAVASLEDVNTVARTVTVLVLTRLASKMYKSHLSFENFFTLQEKEMR